MLELMIFDMDGVLHDSESLSAIAVSACLADRGIDMSPKDIELRYGGKTFKGIADGLEQDLGCSLGAAAAQEFGDRWVSLFEDGLKPTPLIADFLADLQSAQLRLCLASNSARSEIDAALAISGLERFFAPHHRFSGMEVAQPKPAPDLHQACLKHFGLAPQQALVFEDSLTGAGGGLAAGVAVVGYVGVHPQPQSQADALLASGVAACFDDWARVPRDAAGLGRLLGASTHAR